jgi:hypothetical protein
LYRYDEVIGLVQEENLKKSEKRPMVGGRGRGRGRGDGGGRGRGDGEGGRGGGGEVLINRSTYQAKPFYLSSQTVLPIT